MGVEGNLARAECCGGDVCRAASIEVEYQDEKGEEHEERGFEAAVFQHKYDHTVGVLSIGCRRRIGRRSGRIWTRCWSGCMKGKAARSAAGAGGFGSKGKRK